MFIGQPKEEDEDSVIGSDSDEEDELERRRSELRKVTDAEEKAAQLAMENLEQGQQDRARRRSSKDLVTKSAIEDVVSLLRAKVRQVDARVQQVILDLEEQHPALEHLHYLIYERRSELSDSDSSGSMDEFDDALDGFEGCTTEQSKLLLQRKRRKPKPSVAYFPPLIPTITVSKLQVSAPHADEEHSRHIAFQPFSRTDDAANGSLAPLLPFRRRADIYLQLAPYRRMRWDLLRRREAQDPSPHHLRVHVHSHRLRSLHVLSYLDGPLDDLLPD